MIKVLLVLPSFPLGEKALKPVWMTCVPRTGERVIGKSLGVAAHQDVDTVMHNIDDERVTVVLKALDRDAVERQIGENGWIDSSFDIVWPEMK